MKARYSGKHLTEENLSRIIQAFTKNKPKQNFVLFPTLYCYTKKIVSKYFMYYPVKENRILSLLH